MRAKPSERTTGRITMELTMDELRALLGGAAPEAADCSAMATVGRSYFVRTCTYHYVGRLVAMTPGEIILTNCSWVADSGRFHIAMATGELNEVEPYPKSALVRLNRYAYVDMSEWDHKLPEDAK